MHRYILLDADAPGAGGGTTLTDDDKSAVDQLRGQYDVMKAELAKVIIGQDQVVDEMLMCILSRGHGLLMGVPGLAKTLMVNSLSKIMSLGFSRIQFTPDLMPSDITGTEILQEGEAGRRQFEFVKGPIFANIILADEINRTPPKTQSALLEAMQEHRVTTAGEHRELPQPFFVLATQNPIELEGTYPLPEAQLDRFLFNVILDYLDTEDEMEVVDRYTTRVDIPEVSACTTPEQILKFQWLTRQVPVSETVNRFAVNLVRATRPEDELAPEIVKRYVQYGASVRATMFLTLSAKARALMMGRYHVTQDDIKSLVLPVMRHRVLTNYYAESDGVDVDEVLIKLVEQIGVSKQRAKVS